MGVLEKPLIHMFPIKHVAPFLLHLLLGVGNKCMSSLFQCTYERFETLTSSEIEAESMCMISELDYDNKSEQHELLVLEANETRDARISFNQENRGELDPIRQARKDALLEAVEYSRLARDEFKDVLKKPLISLGMRKKRRRN